VLSARSKWHSSLEAFQKHQQTIHILCGVIRVALRPFCHTKKPVENTRSSLKKSRIQKNITMEVDDIYSDIDSDGFVEDMRSFGVGQALPLEVCTCSASLGSVPMHSQHATQTY
jgi:transposase